MDKQDGARRRQVTPSVLVIDDDRLFRDIVGHLLSLSGYRVTTARDGTEGLRCFAEGNHDVVVTDVSMPGPDGWEVARRLRAASDRAGIVVMSASGEAFEARRASISGPIATLAKPFSLEQLLATVRAVSSCRAAA